MIEIRIKLIMVKLKLFYSSKDSIKGLKGQPSEWEKIFIIHLSIEQKYGKLTVIKEMPI